LNNVDSNCNVFSQETKTCTECKRNYFLSGNKTQCILFDSLCRTFDVNTGRCTSCYISFNLNLEGKCVISWSKYKNTFYLFVSIFIFYIIFGKIIIITNYIKYDKNWYQFISFPL
jgi:hypothetical protein